MTNKQLELFKDKWEESLTEYVVDKMVTNKYWAIYNEGSKMAKVGPFSCPDEAEAHLLYMNEDERYDGECVIQGTITQAEEFLRVNNKYSIVQ